MILTEQEVRAIIRERLLLEKTIASVSDLTRLSSVFEEWADLLLDELADKLPNGSEIKEFEAKKRDATIEGMSKAVKMYLIGALGHPMDGYSRRRMDRDNDAAAAKRHKDRIMRGL